MANIANVTRAHTHNIPRVSYTRVVFVSPAAESITLSESTTRLKTANRSISESTISFADSVTRLKTANRAISEGGNLYALNFVAASSQYVDCTNTSTLKVGETAGSEATYVAWIRATSNPSATAYIMGRGTGTAMNMYMRTDGLVESDFHYSTLATDFMTTSIGLGSLANGNWHMIASSHSDISNLSKIYADSVLKQTSATKDDFLGTTSLNRFIIGASATGGTTQANYFTGQIDEVRVYNVELTQAEITRLYLGENITRGLVEYWNFNEGTGGTTIGRVNGIVGTLTNSPTWYNTTLPLGPINISDNLARTKKAIRTASENITNNPTESLARTKYANRPISQSYAVSETLARTAYKNRSSAAQSYSVSDSLARQKKTTRSISDNITNNPSDSLTLTRYYSRSINQSYSVSESLTRTAYKYRSPTTQSYAVSDSLSRIKKSNRVISDNITVNPSDSVVIIRYYNRPITIQSYSVSDSLARTAYKNRVIATEVISISEVLARTKKSSRQISESTLSIFEDLQRQRLVIRTISETPTIALSDSLTRSAKFDRPISEITINLSDSLARQKYVNRSINETGYNVSDSVSVQLVGSGGGAFYHISINEPAYNISDTLTRVSYKYRAPAAETIAIGSGSLSRTKIAQRQPQPQSITISDILLRTALLIRSITDNSLGTITGTLTSRALKSRSIQEGGITIQSGALVRQLLANRSISTPSITITDTLSRTALKSRSINAAGAGTYSLNDSLARIKIYPRSINESTININDSLTRSKYVQRVIVQSYSVNDSIIVNKILQRIIAPQVITLSDLITSHKIASREITDDDGLVTDQLTRTTYRTRTFIEPTINVSDNLHRTLLFIIQRSIIEPHIPVGPGILSRLKTVNRYFSENISPILPPGEIQIQDSDNFPKLLTAFLRQNWISPNQPSAPHGRHMQPLGSLLSSLPNALDIRWDQWYNGFGDIHLKIIEFVTFARPFDVGWNFRDYDTSADIHIFVRSTKDLAGSQPITLTAMRSYIEKIISQNPRGLQPYGIASMWVSRIKPIPFYETGKETTRQTVFRLIITVQAKYIKRYQTSSNEV